MVGLKLFLKKVLCKVLRDNRCYDEKYSGEGDSFIELCVNESEDVIVMELFKFVDDINIFLVFLIVYF